MNDERMDEILDAMKNEPATEAELEQAKARVLKRLSSTSVCAEIRAEFDTYKKGELSEARQALVADHLSRCAECRRAMEVAEGTRKVVEMPAARPVAARTGLGWRKWAVAAGLAAVALFAARDRIDSALAPSGARAKVESASGGLYTVEGKSIGAGVELGEAEAVRTASGARAVLRLADGSAVEMNERTELAVRSAWSGQTVDLVRGDIIIEAAKQRRAGLRVLTPDSTATVKGTIFAVTAGIRGSMVGVVEGSVAVRQPGSDVLLKPGETAATNPELARVEVREAVGWSRNSANYQTLLAELAAIEKKLAELPGPPPRFESRLLAYMPAGTVAFGSMPNMGGTIQQAVEMIERRTWESEVLREWWDSKEGETAREMLKHVEEISPLLGDEVVLMMVKKSTPNNAQPLILAEVKPGKQADLEAAIARLASRANEPLPYRITGNLLMASESKETLAELVLKLGTGAASPFAAEIKARYATGVNWLFALDVQALGDGLSANSAASVVGIEKMNYVFFEQKRSSGGDEIRASLNFKSARSGLVSFLGEPGPMGSADYVSPEAFIAISASTKNPRQAFDELAELISKAEPGFRKNLGEFEAQTGVNVAGDLASALGADFTFVIETPRIPVPAWVAVMEVYNPQSLDTAAERLTQTANRELSARNKTERMAFGRTETGGRTWRSLKMPTGNMELTWTYDRGYLVLSSDRATAERAIANRSGGYPLVRSAAFRTQMPGMGGAHHSGFLWVNTKGALKDLAGLTPNPAFKQLLEARDPVLVVFDGSTERIEASSRTRLTSLVFDVLMASGASRQNEEKAPATAKR